MSFCENLSIFEEDIRLNFSEKKNPAEKLGFLENPIFVKKKLKQNFFGPKKTSAGVFSIFFDFISI